MRVLWITNLELPRIASYFGRTVFREGWIDQTSKLLSQDDHVQLHVLSWAEDIYYEVNVDNVYYSSYHEYEISERLKKLLDDINPDIIHLWGSENIHSYDAVEQLKVEKRLDRTVVSIQGLVSECAEAFYDGIPKKTVYKHTIYELIKHNNVYESAEEFRQRGIREKELFKTVKYCIGRTDWDYNAVKRINPNINYYKCNETLREPFYNHVWEFNKCEKHSIAYSQIHYPIKGFHFMIEALNIIKSKYPDVKLKVAGESLFRKRSIKERIKARTFDRYIRELIDKYNLRDNIQWMGYMDADRMVEHYLSANVFVCASTIENSSNSIGEAMLLGVPVVASDVGGTRSILNDGKDGLLFGKGDVKTLAAKVTEILDDSDKAVCIGRCARISAQKIYDRESNIMELINIYQTIINKYLYKKDER